MNRKQRCGLWSFRLFRITGDEPNPSFRVVFDDIEMKFLYSFADLFSNLFRLRECCDAQM